MTPEVALSRLGNLASLDELLQLTTRHAIRTSLSRGTITRPAHGLYQLGDIPDAVRAARALEGVVSHLSAAVHHGWKVKLMPELPWVTVPHKRRIRGRTHALLGWSDLPAADFAAGVTTPVRTVIDCARRLPFDEGLAVADSALRSGLSPLELREAAQVARGPGSVAARRVVACASPLAANPFESVLRAQALEFTWPVEPQGPIVTPTRTYHPDIVIRPWRLALEADSHEFHTDRAAFARDCERYDALTLAGWRVLRFTWMHVMRQPDWIRQTLRAARRAPFGQAIVTLPAVS